MNDPRLRGARRSTLLGLSSFVCTTALVACNSGGGSSEERSDGPVGAIVARPDGTGRFIVDRHQLGEASRLKLLETFWGRLVDVHDVDAQGTPSATPLFRDFVVREELQSDGSDYLLETNPLTQATRLVVLRTLGAPDAGFGTFEDLLREATEAMAPVFPKHDDGSSTEPFSFVARNAVLVLVFDDLLRDDAGAAAELVTTVHVRSGYPPAQPENLRVSFDQNHGGILAGRFHATRVLVDTTVSRVEAASMPVPLPENLLGLPASSTSTGQPNVSIRIPTRVDPASGQFAVLRGVQGAEVSSTENGPVAFGSPTVDVVRAMRSGNPLDLSRGFLSDAEAPSVVSGWPVSVDAARADPAGLAGLDHLFDLTFATICRKAPAEGDVLQVGARFVQVRRAATAPNPATGAVRDVAVRVIDNLPLPDPSLLLGGGSYATTYDPAAAVEGGCWITVEPPPGIFPSRAVSPEARLVVRFSEPMDPSTLGAFDELQLLKGRPPLTATATNSVVATVSSSGDLREHVLAPLLPLEHNAGATEPFTLLLAGGADGPTDLGGNPLERTLPPIELFLDPLASGQGTGGLVLRFEAANEVNLGDPSPGGNDDIRGQVFYDFARGTLRPRQVTRGAWVVDQSQLVPSLMLPLPVGIDSPLSPLGSKLQTLWRYADVGWLVDDETKYDLDVEGLSWAPFNGASVAEFYDGFEIRLGHSVRLPDEYVDALGVLLYPSSGLLDAPHTFADNLLQDALSPQTAVHERSRGYLVDPGQAFRAASGTLLQPFPQNRGSGPHLTYTWRDTSVLARGGPNGAGIPLQVETALGLYPGMTPGAIAGPGQVPSIGLPLLLEFRCYPANNAVGANRFAVAVARAGQLFPTFRVHSTGGTNTQGRRVLIDPDLAPVPSGGFNPSSSPPGQRTRSADPALYFGQLETVVRVSRAHTIWLDTGSVTPDFEPAVIEPDPQDQPAGSSVVLDYRGATGFSGTQGQEFDAASLDAYGDTLRGSVSAAGGQAGWSSSVDSIDGARYVQVRLSFLSDVASGRHAELETLALAFRR